ncbi:hypothetical protein F511_41512 [Dorcoceras hygrometricum]|uniref:CCHC-type domain-containing protein n=1 Tax=Dorcoceras hygrometricum TaxID=472368 RepID=A0A2Z7BMV6_9LAMI|nr:hypothetical protein F511_41512 [Dorcoceras hygrometricum]
MRAGRAWWTAVASTRPAFSHKTLRGGGQYVRHDWRTLAAGRCRAWRGGVRPCAACYVGGGRRRAAAVRRISGSDATANFLLGAQPRRKGKKRSAPAKEEKPNKKPKEKDSKPNRSEDVCHHCHKPWHWRRNCKEYLEQLRTAKGAQPRRKGKKRSAPAKEEKPNKKPKEKDSKPNRSEDVCHHCHKPWHWRRNCKEYLEQLRTAKVDWAVKMRIRPPELETSICDVKYHVSLSTGCVLGKWVCLVTLAMSLFDLQDVCIVIGSLATLDLPMVVDLIGIYVLKGPYCTLTTTNWFLQALSVIPRGSWRDVARRFTMIRWASPKL